MRAMAGPICCLMVYPHNASCKGHATNLPDVNAELNSHRSRAASIGSRAAAADRPPTLPDDLLRQSLSWRQFDIELGKNVLYAKQM